MGQACVGKHYIHKKPIYDRWKSEYIPFAVRPPITLLSVVYFLEPDKLRRVHSDFNNSVVFDKGRILKYFNSTDPELNHKIIQFVDTNINEE